MLLLVMPDKHVWLKSGRILPIVGAGIYYRIRLQAFTRGDTALVPRLVLGVETVVKGSRYLSSLRTHSIKVYYMT